VLAPILWISRQQADPDTMVDAIVSERAQHVADSILRAANDEHPVIPR
jgi:mannitol-1-phosphate/altronate dehydrogenase